MATTTRNLWPTPDDTDYVKDGAAAIRAALEAVDADLNLTGGAAGDVLQQLADGTFAPRTPSGATSVEVAKARVETTETTTSTTYTDLTTVGPSVTIDVGASGVAVVTISALIFNSVADNSNAALMSFAGSGGNTLAADDGHTLRSSDQYSLRGSAVIVLTGLTPGSTTFTAKYRVAKAATGTFAQREISVLTY